MPLFTVDLFAYRKPNKVSFLIGMNLYCLLTNNFVGVNLLLQTNNNELTNLNNIVS